MVVKDVDGRKWENAFRSADYGTFESVASYSSMQAAENDDSAFRIQKTLSSSSTTVGSMPVGV